MKKDAGIRLNRFIAMCCVCSRRKADNLIQQELMLITQGLKKEDLEKNKKENEIIAKKRKNVFFIFSPYLY